VTFILGVGIYYWVIMKLLVNEYNWYGARAKNG